MATPPPSAPSASETDLHASTARNARYGLILFSIYVLLYGGFMGLSAFWPDLMGSRPLFGVNLAILYGIGLIVAAWILAFFYMYLCRRRSGEAESGR